MPARALALFAALGVAAWTLSGCSIESRFYRASLKSFATPEGVQDMSIPVSGGTVHAWFVPGPMLARQAATAHPACGEHLDNSDSASTGAIRADDLHPEPLRRPALLFCHGALFTIDRLLPHLSPIAERAGVALMMVSYRGFGRSSPLERITRRTTADDAIAAFDALAARPDVDPARIVVMGYSLGGPPAAAVARARPVAGLVIGGTYSRAADALDDLGLSRYAWLIGNDLDPAPTVAQLGQKRPVPPLLVVHAEDDESTRSYHAFAIAASAARAGVPVSVRIIPGAGHREVFLESSLRDAVAEFTSRVVAGPARSGEHPSSD